MVTRFLCTFFFLVRPIQLATSIVFGTVAESMIVACRKTGEGFTTLHSVMASEIIGVRMMAPGSTPTRRGPPTRLCFDVRFLSCESIRPTDTAPDGPISLAASTWRFEGDVARVPAGEDAATFTGELEQLEPEWEVRPFSSPAPRAISASCERGGCVLADNEMEAVAVRRPAGAVVSS